MEEAIIPEIVRLAEECGNFAIRGYGQNVQINKFYRIYIYGVRILTVCTEEILSDLATLMEIDGYYR